MEDSERLALLVRALRGGLLPPTIETNTITEVAKLLVSECREETADAPADLYSQVLAGYALLKALEQKLPLLLAKRLQKAIAEII